MHKKLTLYYNYHCSNVGLDLDAGDSWQSDTDSNGGVCVYDNDNFWSSSYV